MVVAISKRWAQLPKFLKVAPNYLMKEELFIEIILPNRLFIVRT